MRKLDEIMSEEHDLNGMDLYGPYFTGYRVAHQQRPDNRVWLAVAVPRRPLLMDHRIRAIVILELAQRQIPTHSVHLLVQMGK